MIRLLTHLLLLVLVGCGSSEQGIEGQLLFQGQPLAGAQLEVYLKSGEERSTSPFTVAGTDEKGRYRVELPAGSYYLIGKMKQQTAGLNRMLMAEAPVNPYRVANDWLQLPAFELLEMGLGGTLHADPDTWVEGVVTLAGQPLADAFVYLYTEGSTDLMGPSYAKVVQTDSSGYFRLDLPAGRYWLAARKRLAGRRSGVPEVGDLNGSYAGNPIELSRGEQLRLSTFALVPVAQSNYQLRMEAGKFTVTDTLLRGRAVDDQEQPLSGIYVFAYVDSRMIGKPSYISAPTGNDGRFELFLGRGGNYFIGARSTFGGPLEPGEWVGTYDVQVDHGIQVEQGSQTVLGDLVLKEVW